MKRVLLLPLTLCCWVATAWADDGSFTWGNNPTGFRAPVFGPDPTHPYNSITGQPDLGAQFAIPAGSTVYPGPLLQGTGYTFGIYVGPVSASSNSLTLLASTTFRTSTSGNNLLPGGLINGGTRTVSGVPAGEPVHFQIRVWDNKGGTLNDWASAQSAWLSGTTDAGVSPVVTSSPLGGTDSTGLPILTPSDSGWVSFNIYYIPEPAVLAIAALGAAGCIIFRRRASSN